MQFVNLIDPSEFSTCLLYLLCYVHCTLVKHNSEIFWTGSPTLAGCPDLGDDPVLPVNIVTLITGGRGAGVIGDQSQNASKWEETEVNILLGFAVDISNFLN